MDKFTKDGQELARQVYLALVDKANEASTAYYDKDEPIMSDYEFDELMKKIKAYEFRHNYVAPDSPTKRVGGSTGKSTFKKLTHVVPMLSLMDVFSFEDVLQWLEAFPKGTLFDVEEKIDGLSMSVTYEGGKLVRAETRGDGYVGEDITENAKFIDGIPTVLKLPVKNQAKALNRLEVRCEVYLPVDRFLEINKEREQAGEKLFANPRNAAAGLLRTKDLDAVKNAKLHAFAFNVQGDDLVNALEEHFNDSHRYSLLALEEMGFDTVTSFMSLNVTQAITDIGESRDGLPYWIDGAVVKVDSLSLRKEEGETNKYPRWAIAFKYPPEEKETVIRDIILQTGRTGRITPVAVFDPVYLGGTTVTKATLNNPEFIEGLGVNIGDKVIVRKAAEIIPQIVRVSEKLSEGVYDVHAHTCPSCGGKIVYAAEDLTGAYCCNPECPAQIARKFEHWASRDCMDIRGFGPAVIDKLIDAGLLNSIPDIYRLKDRDIVAVETALGGKKICDNLIKAIDDSKTRDLDRLVKALGIVGVGRHIGKELAKRYPDILAVGELPLGKDGRQHKIAELAAIDGIGEISATAIMTWFATDGSWKMLFDLGKAGVNLKSLTFKSSDDKTVGVFDGLTFVITGTLPTMSREDANEFVEKNGGRVSSSVSKKTDYLIVGENAGSKLDKAKALGVEIIDEAMMFALANGEGKVMSITHD